MNHDKSPFNVDDIPVAKRWAQASVDMLEGLDRPASMMAFPMPASDGELYLIALAAVVEASDMDEYLQGMTAEHQRLVGKFGKPQDRSEAITISEHVNKAF